MMPRIGLDMEPGVQMARLLPGLDLLDIAYAASHGGAQIIMVPVTAFVASAAYTPDLFHRPGLPLFCVKAEPADFDRLAGLGHAPDRIMMVGERQRAMSEIASVADILMHLTTGGHELAVLVEPEIAVLKELARARAQWAVFPTENLAGAGSPEIAEAELARLTAAALAANRLKLRVGLWGPTGRHLPPALAAVPHCEEIYPAPDLWAMALRAGWERAVMEYQHLLR
jgi:hypothetical protein